MNTKVINQKGKEVGTMELPSELFEVMFKADVVQHALLAQRANARQTIAHTKGRGEVRGGGKKPWKQKGTGRARHASIRSPIWKGGGVAFGPTKERNFEQKINKKTFRKALAMVLSSKLNDGELTIMDRMTFTEPKTKEAVGIFKAMNLGRGKVLVVTPAKDRNAERAIRNLPNAAVISADSLNVHDLLQKKFLVVLQDAVAVMQGIYKR